MNPLIAQLQTLMGGRLATQALGRLGVVGTLLKSLGAPVFIVMVLAMMVLPLPPFMLDLLFTFNIAIALR